MAKKQEFEKIPPQNIEAEQALLGCILLDGESIIKIIDLISPSDFYKPEHELIYDAMLFLFNERTPIDLITLTNLLEKRGKLEEIGGASYLTTLANSVPTAAHIVDYAKIVQEKATLRNLITAATEIINLGYQEDKDVEVILDKSEQILFSVSEKKLKQNFVPLSNILGETFERIDKLSKHKGELRGVPTGFPELDFLLSGLQPSDLIVLAARPSMGKTSLALNIAENAAISKNIPVAIFSLEMSKEQIVERFLSSVSGVNSWKIRTGNLDEEDFSKLGEAFAVLSEAPIFIDDSANINVMEIRAKARKLSLDKKIGLIIVDYLQLMVPAHRAESRVQEISEISRALKSLARELNIPVLAISQLSRAVETRHPQIPQLADLRESGSIEQDADVVMFIYREDYYDKDSPRKNIADVMIKKHRNGPLGTVELYFQAELMRFRSLEKQREEEIPVYE